MHIIGINSMFRVHPTLITSEFTFRCLGSQLQRAETFSELHRAVYSVASAAKLASYWLNTSLETVHHRIILLLLWSHFVCQCWTHNVWEISSYLCQRINTMVEFVTISGILYVSCTVWVTPMKCCTMPMCATKWTSTTQLFCPLQRTRSLHWRSWDWPCTV